MTPLEGIGLISLVVAGWQAVSYWRAEHGRTLYEHLASLREFLQTIAAEGGVDSRTYLTEERRATSVALEDLIPRLRDPALREHCTKVMDAYNKSFVLAPGRRGPRFWTLGGPPDPEYAAEDAARAQQFQAQLVEVRAALEHIRTALQRLNKIERYLLRRGS